MDYTDTKAFHASRSLQTAALAESNICRSPQVAFRALPPKDGDSTASHRHTMSNNKRNKQQQTSNNQQQTTTTTTNNNNNNNHQQLTGRRSKRVRKQGSKEGKNKHNSSMLQPRFLPSLLQPSISILVK